VTGQLVSIQAIIDADDLPCFALDRELRYTAFNRAHAAAMRELYGAEIALGGRLPDYQTVAADRETAVANLKRALAGERVTAGALSGDEGSQRYFDVVHTPLTDDAGVVVGVVVRAYEGGRPLAVAGYTTDVTEQQHTEAALRLATDRLALATRAGGVGVWDWDVGSDTLVWDEQMFALYGIRREQFAGAYEAWRAGLHPDDRERGDAEIQAVLRGEKELDTEFRVLWPDGTEHAIRALALVQRDEAGAPTRMIGTNWDITEFKTAEEKIQRLNADLERRVAERTRDLTPANSELEDFVYSIAHDLRSPLRALGSFSEIVSTDYADVIDATGQSYLHRIHAAAVHMGAVMDALLALSRVNRTDILVQDVDLSALARQVADQLREAEPQRSVQFEIEDGLIATADASLCEVLLQNLLGNAWKFSAGESPARISFGRVSVDGRDVYCVSDNGVGFAQKYAGRLFKPFERLHAPGEFPGTGIGLATVRRIVTLLEGDCWAEARVGEGARVFFTLPAPESAH
jgi:PAS domain S-box-containing protein